MPNMPDLSRRTILLGSVAIAATASVPALAAPDLQIHVARGASCGCCVAWVKYLRSEGFTVTDEELASSDLVRRKLDLGVPQPMMSCHTATINGYFVEGHVPAADIRRLLAERPDALGIAVPEMPYGSPGMGPEDQREAYEVFLIRRDGSSEVFQSYDAAT